MITRSDLRKIARERLKDAEVLLKAGRYDGAIYLGGYVVEIALKCRICKTLKWPGFPQTPGEFKAYQSLKTHNLDVLLSLSGVEAKIKTNYLKEWLDVASWDPEARYKPLRGASKADAEALLRAAKKLLEVLWKDKLEQFTQLEQRIAKEKGEFSLFALFLREDAPDKWDLVVAAPWMDADRSKALGYLAEQIKRAFAPAELTRLSRVVIVDQDSPELGAINRAMKVSHSDVEVQNSNFFGLQIKHAHIITSQQVPVVSESAVVT